jgi:hypothetical protein
MCSELSHLVSRPLVDRGSGKPARGSRAVEREVLIGTRSAERAPVAMQHLVRMLSGCAGMRVWERYQVSGLGVVVIVSSVNWHVATAGVKRMRTYPEGPPTVRCPQTRSQRDESNCKLHWGRGAGRLNAIIAPVWFKNVCFWHLAVSPCGVGICSAAGELRTSRPRSKSRISDR